MTRIEQNFSATEGDSDVAEALDEIADLLDAGQPVDMESYVRRHPHLESQLRAAVESLRGVYQLRADFRRDASERELPMSATLGDFRLLRELGRGGMGIVYEAEQISLGRRVAIKTLPLATLLDPRQLERFKNEARAAAMLKHPHIVSVYSVGCQRGGHFYAMELIEGQSLADVIEEMRIVDFGRGEGSRPHNSSSANVNTPSPAPETDTIAAISTNNSDDRKSFYRNVARLGTQIADALQFAHDHSVVHRDIKPSNLLLDRLGNLHLADFGLAQIEKSQSVTGTGDLVGTLRYMSPEQLEHGIVVDHRTDVYSLGLALCEFVCGQPIFSGTTRAEVIRHVLDGPPTSLRRFDGRIPHDLETVLLKAIARNRDERYPTAGDLRDDLTRFHENRPITARRVGRLEQARRWAVRNPGLAGLSAAVIALLVLIATASSALAWKLARAARLHELTSYAQDTRLVQHEIDQGNYAAAQRRLLHWASSDKRRALRGLEWYYLWDQCQRRAAKHTIEEGLAVDCVAFSQDGQLVAVGSFGKKIKIFDVETRDKIRVLESDSKSVDVLLVRRNGQFVSGDTDGNVIFWDLDSSQRIQTLRLELPVEYRYISSISESADGRFLAIGSSAIRSNEQLQAYVFVWDTRKHRFVAKLQDGLRGQPFVGFTAEHLAVGCGNGALRLFQQGTWEPVFEHNCGGQITALDASNDDHFVAIASAARSSRATSSNITIWDTHGWERQSIVTPLHGRIEALAFSYNDHRLAAGDVNGRLSLIDIDTAETVLSRQLHAGSIYAIAFSDDHRHLCTGSNDNTARIWDVDSLLQDQQHTVIPAGHDTSVLSTGLLNARQACSIDGSGRLAMWDVATRELRTEFQIETQGASFAQLAVSKDGSLIAACRSHFPEQPIPVRATIIDVARKRRRLDFLLPRGCVALSIAFSHDSSQVALTSKKYVVVRSTETDRVLTELPFEDNVKGVAYAPNGRWLVCCGDGGVTKVYDTQTWNCVQTIKSDAWATMAAGISPDSRCVATAGNDGRVKLWSLPDGKPVGADFPTINQLMLRVRFSPDGSRILTTAKDGRLRLWQTESGDELLSVAVSNNWLWDGSFDPNGQSIVVASGTEVRILKTDIDSLRSLSVEELEVVSCESL